MSEIESLNAEISNGALKGNTLPKRLKILDWGKNSTTKGDVYLTAATLKVFKDNQKKWGRDEDVAIDFDHCTVPGSNEFVPGKPKHVAGYGNPELIEGDGLYLNDIEWTPEGKDMGKNYKDLSPAVKTNAQGVVEALHSCALTPNGAVYDLKFYSATMDEVIKNMSEESYNKDGANAGVQKIGNEYKAVTGLDDAGVKEDDEDSEYLCHYDADGKLLSKIKKAKTGSIDSDKTKTKTKTMSANNPSFPDAYEAQPNHYNTMNDTILKMAAELGMDGGTDADRVLAAFLAKYIGLRAEFSQQITQKENTEEGGLKQFSTALTALEAKVKELESKNVEQLTVNTRLQRENLVKQATREGKIIPLSADAIEKIDVAMLEEIVSKQQKNVVPMKSVLKTLSVDSKDKVDYTARAKAIFDAQISKQS